MSYFPFHLQQDSAQHQPIKYLLNDALWFLVKNYNIKIKIRKNTHILIFKVVPLGWKFMSIWSLVKIKCEENRSILVSVGQHSISKPNTFEFLLNHHR